jgi:hypothetical protein
MPSHLVEKSLPGEGIVLAVEKGKRELVPPLSRNTTLAFSNRCTVPDLGLLCSKTRAGCAKGGGTRHNKRKRLSGRWTEPAAYALLLFRQAHPTTWERSGSPPSRRKEQQDLGRWLASASLRIVPDRGGVDSSNFRQQTTPGRWLRSVQARQDQ